MGQTSRLHFHHSIPSWRVCVCLCVCFCVGVYVEKEGSCPVSSKLCPPRPPPPACESDSDCIGKRKCCTPLCRQKCVNPVKGNVLPDCQICPGLRDQRIGHI
uniref:WAP domain-containing protein n=1 Tax=Leptobrachium leishanense TaxID=445787 RepID=A0A8C5WH17_9ANUR